MLIGYDLTAPPTLGPAALDWRFDLIFGTAALVLAAVYLPACGACAAAVMPGPSAGRWPGWPDALACWSLPAPGSAATRPAMFSVHMAEHMILSMLVPILLVLGAPVTLALRALPPAGRSPPGRASGCWPPCTRRRRAG